MVDALVAVMLVLESIVVDSEFGARGVDVVSEVLLVVEVVVK